MPARVYSTALSTQSITALSQTVLPQITSIVEHRKQSSGESRDHRTLSDTTGLCPLADYGPGKYCVLAHTRIDSPCPQAEDLGGILLASFVARIRRVRDKKWFSGISGNDAFE
jgi:hypothetical protein